MGTTNSSTPAMGNYAGVNGISMYYEIHGDGFPLVLLHGGGSTIYTSFGRLLPHLAKTHKVIAVELQAHGHTGDRDAPETFEQDAADVAELLRQLEIPKADIFGFSNGGQTALELAIHRPEKINKLVIASAFYKRDGVFAGFWDGFAGATLNNMPQLYHQEYLKITNDPARLQNMFDKDVQRMSVFKGWTDEEIKSIQAPAFVISGNHDVATPEHTVEMYRTLPNATLAILPGNHGSYMGEALSPDVDDKAIEHFAAMVDAFLGG